MDLATIIGVVSGFSLIVGAIILGGGALAFINIPAMMITFGGTIAATLISFPLPTILQTFKVVRNTFFFSLPTEDAVIKNIFHYNEIYLKEGPQKLENEIDNVKYPFLIKALELIVIGTKVPKINQVLQSEINNFTERHKRGQNIMVTMGTFAPAFGMIGTLIGLIQMLRQLDDPSKIGAGMAVALITTFYGALIANLLFLPLATKLKERSKQEKNLCTLIKDGMLSVAMREGKRFVEDHMITFLSQTDRDKVMH